MSFTVVGYPGATLVQNAPQYNAEAKIYSYVREYQGTEEAIRGLETNLVAAGRSYRTSHQGPIWSLFFEEPVEDLQEDVDRWEISTESTEKSIFELPSMIAVAADYDAGIADGEDTFRQAAEKAAQAKNSTFLTAFIDSTLPDTLIHHLKAGVTGWQVDLVVMRRTRRVQSYTAQNLRITLDTGLLIYSTAQLGLPATVAFAVPATPASVYVTIAGTPNTELFRWGWRKRSQRVEIIGEWTEQTVELLFAPWSLTEYTISSTALAW